MEGDSDLYDDDVEQVVEETEMEIEEEAEEEAAEAPDTYAVEEVAITQDDSAATFERHQSEVYSVDMSKNGMY